jgi:hypothetical protein
MALVTQNGLSPRNPRSRLDYHDPTAGVGGAPPAASALTLRLLLASIALACCVTGIVLDTVLDGPVVLTGTLVVLAITTIVDVSVIVRRKRRGEPG